MVRSSPRASLVDAVSKCGQRQMCGGSGDFLLTMRRCGSQVLTGRGPRRGGGPHGAHRVKVGWYGSGNGRLTRSNGSDGVSSMIRHLGSEEEKVEVGKGALATGEGGAPFYRGKGAWRRSVKAAVRPMALNGAHEWSPEGEGKMVVRGGDRAAAPFYFSTGGEERRWDTDSGRRSEVAQCFIPGRRRQPKAIGSAAVPTEAAGGGLSGSVGGGD
jgi:hypothetical protein